MDISRVSLVLLVVALTRHPDPSTQFEINYAKKLSLLYQQPRANFIGGLLACGPEEWKCDSGDCIDRFAVCDGGFDCEDRSDETNCLDYAGSVGSNATAVRGERGKREVTCARKQWRCLDGNQCIQKNKLCNAFVDCEDGSDETMNLCQNIVCDDYLFKCDYGACISKALVCDGNDDCVDKSDEFNCPNSNPTTTVSSVTQRNPCGSSFKCDDGKCVQKTKICDGVKDCLDGSDETKKVCSNNTCPQYSFRCVYGGCIPSNLMCDGKYDCPDLSDEGFSLCNTAPPAVPTTGLTTSKPQSITAPTTTPATPITGVTCTVPPPPEDGYYKRSFLLGRTPENNTKVQPDFVVEVYCKTTHSLVGLSLVKCTESGSWSQKFPLCKQRCTSLTTRSGQLECTLNGDRVDCSDSPSHNTVAVLKCQAGHKDLTKKERETKCLEGSWTNKLSECKPDCGFEVSLGIAQTINGVVAKRGQVPWHVTIYELSAETGDYEQICGGSIITETLVVSAAHCVWIEGKKEPRDIRLFKVVAGKFNRDYNNSTGDSRYRQDREVKNFTIPERYGGDGQHQQADILLIELSKPFEFSQHVTTVCIDRDASFEDYQLKNLIGRVAGMGLTSEGGIASPELRYVDLPAKSYDECLLRVPETFKRYLTLDKVCAGFLNGTGVCSGDSGGGLSFPETSRGETRWYLRAIVSVGVPLGRDSVISCRDNIYSAFTRLIKHMDWLDNAVGYEL